MMESRSQPPKSPLSPATSKSAFLPRMWTLKDVGSIRYSSGGKGLCFYRKFQSAPVHLQALHRCHDTAQELHSESEIAKPRLLIVQVVIEGQLVVHFT